MGITLSYSERLNSRSGRAVFLKERLSTVTMIGEILGKHKETLFFACSWDFPIIVTVDIPLYGYARLPLRSLQFLE